MHRFYLPPEKCAGDTLALTGSEAHHAAHVLRVRPGEQVAVLDGVGGTLLCEVTEVARSTVQLHLLKRRQAQPLNPAVTLFQGLPKGKLIEDIIEKATELGVTRVVPLLTERVIARFEAEEASAKQAKWQAVAMEAIKQCGQPWLPMIEKPQALSAALSGSYGLKFQIVGSLRADAKHPRNYFSVFREFKAGATHPLSIGIWVGPEGDFTPTELDSIQLKGALPISLGSLVLRCETAAIFCLSIVNYELAAGGSESRDV